MTDTPETDFEDETELNAEAGLDATPDDLAPLDAVIAERDDWKDKAMRLAEGIRAGQVYVNVTSAGTGIELPFGGYKHSGWGREKGLEALASYTQTKNVCIGFGDRS